MMLKFKKGVPVSIRYIVPCLVSLASPLLATDYAFLNEDAFVRQDTIWHFESDFSKVGAAEMTTGETSGSKMHYSEGNASIYFSHFIGKENALAWQLGANYVGFDWDKNPTFNDSNYVYGITSLNWISYSIDKWRWVFNGGVSVDTKTFNFGKSGVYFATAWGRATINKSLGLHVGFFAYYGALNGYVLPILGADYWATPKWELRAVFPLDASINYHFNKHFTTSILATSMGGPYRFPRRIHGGSSEFEDGIFKVYSTAVEWDVKFAEKDMVSLGAGAGYDFGGWIQVANSEGHNKTYYDFDGAPYGRVFATLTF